MEGTNICLAMHIKKLKVGALCVVTYRVPAQADKKDVVQHIFLGGGCCGGAGATAATQTQRSMQGRDHHRPYLFWPDAVDGRNSMCATGPGRCMWSTPFSVEHEPGVHIQVCSGVCDSLTPISG
jgi:hypothetical protein